MYYNKRISFFTILKVLFLLVMIAITVYPFIYMFSVSASKDVYVMKNQISFYPKGFNLRIYRYVLSDQRIFTSYINTIVYTVVGTFISLIVTCGGAYALSKKNKMVFFKFFNMIIIITMFFGGGLIPTYLTVKALGMLDSIWAVVLPGTVSTWNLMVMRSFFVAFPQEIEESGELDGMNDIQIFWYLVLPVSQAVLATIGLFYGVGLWNGYFGPMIYLNTPEKFTLQVILRDILLAGSNINNEVVGVSSTDVIVADSLKYAAAIVSIIPVIIVYPFLQKYFVKGVMVGSLKG